MRGAILGILAGTALAFGSTAANASLTVLAGGCDASLSGGCTAANPASPAPATISWSDADVGASPFSASIDFNNTLAGNYFASLTTADPAVFFTNLTIYAIVGGAGSATTGPALMQYSGGPTHSISLLPASFGSGNFRLSFSGTTSGGGGEGGTLSFFAAVPEPSTWALMLFGFGAMGVALRRRRRPVLAQIA
jgi:PEP-CTERM motif